MTTWNSDPFKAWGRGEFLCETSISILPPPANTLFADNPGGGEEPGLAPNLSPPPTGTLVQLSLEAYNDDEEAILVRTLDGDTTYGWLKDGPDWNQLWGFLRLGFRVVGGVSGVAEVQDDCVGDVIWWVGSKFKNAQEEQLWLESMVGDE